MNVNVDFVVETFSLLVWSHVSSVCMYSCRCLAAVSKLGCCEKTVISSSILQDGNCVRVVEEALWDDSFEKRLKNLLGELASKNHPQTECTVTSVYSETPALFFCLDTNN